MIKRLKLIAISCAFLFLQGCSLGYYSHLAKGQYNLMQKRKPLIQVINAKDTSPALKERLLLTQKALAFAEKNLLIDVDDRYSDYVDLKRPYVLWSLSAAPELSFSAYKWCYPIVGCANYRGYFDYEKAQEVEKELQALGYETYLRGVSAYSTLGWFSDPLINTFIHYSEKEYLTLIFHELAHSKLYIKNNTRFNESFATFVGEQAYKEFKEEQQLQEPVFDQARKESYEDLKNLILKYRKELKVLYKSDRDIEEKRKVKKEIMANLQEEYETLKQSWSHSGYDQWINTLNNAKFMVYSDYESKVPLFETMFNECQQDWACFYNKAQQAGDKSN